MSVRRVELHRCAPQRWPSAYEVLAHPRRALLTCTQGAQPCTARRALPATLHGAPGARAQGGYYAWFRIFDNKLNRRKSGEYAEQYTHDGDSCGIHSSGAGFPRMDPADQWVPPAFE